jgi:hypothetical protein
MIVVVWSRLVQGITQEDNRWLWIVTDECNLRPLNADGFRRLYVENSHRDLVAFRAPC